MILSLNQIAAIVQLPHVTNRGVSLGERNWTRADNNFLRFSLSTTSDKLISFGKVCYTAVIAQRDGTRLSCVLLWTVHATHMPLLGTREASVSLSLLIKRHVQHFWSGLH